MKRIALLAAAFLVALAAHADVRPFKVGSLATVRAAHDGRPFILSFWSLDCAHCPTELEELGALKRRHPLIDVVLVSTDVAADVSMLGAFAARHGLGGAEQWVFADPQPQKLRFEVDRRWWGELPRTYLFDADHKTEAHSGPVKEEALKAWVSRNYDVRGDQRNSR